MNTVRRPAIRLRAAKDRQAVFLGMKSTGGRMGWDNRQAVERRAANRARICTPFKEPRNRFPAGRAGTTTLLVVLARQAT
jgi:hypothetical protein